MGYDELMEFGKCLRANAAEREKFILDAKKKEEEWRRAIAYTEELKKLSPDYPFSNTPFVYFLKGQNNLVKIGYSWEVPARVRTMASELFNNNCQVIGLFHGGRELEERCHNIFDDYRLIGTREIFFHSEQMSTYLQNVMTDEERKLVKRVNEKLDLYIKSEVR